MGQLFTNNFKEIKMSYTREFLINEYLDFKNNYLTPALFSEHRGITQEQGQILIDLGRSVFNSNHIES